MAGIPNGVLTMWFLHGYGNLYIFCILYILLCNWIGIESYGITSY